MTIINHHGCELTMQKMITNMYRKQRLDSKHQDVTNKFVKVLHEIQLILYREHLPSVL